MYKKYKNLVEIGAGDEFSSEGLKFLSLAEKITLFEPNIILSNSLEKHCSKFDNIKIEKVAISKNDELYHFGYASFIDGSFSFVGSMIESEGFKYLYPLKKKVQIKSVSDIDDGSIDFLILTINGDELEILKDLKSTPKLILTKSYCHTHLQYNHFNLLNQWMSNHNYSINMIDTNKYSTYFHIAWKKIL